MVIMFVLSKVQTLAVSTVLESIHADYMAQLLLDCVVS